MKQIMALCLLVLCSCQSKPNKRIPSHTEYEEMTIDEKFEEYEGGSPDREEEIHQKIISFSRQLMDRMHQAQPHPQTMTRDAHAKSHGCLKAEFVVDNKNLPERNRVGLFSDNKSYSAWVRFSNNDHLPVRKDNKLDLRGMAIKVMGVEGKKVLMGSENDKTQDFLMYGSKTFFIKNNEDYVGFIKGLRDDNAAKVLVTEQPKAALRTFRAQWRVRNYINPLNMPYHSGVPIRLGRYEDPERVAIKYQALPCQKTSFKSVVSKKDVNYMRKNMKETLGENDACYDFQIQISKGLKTMPVEDSTVKWPEKAFGRSRSGHAPYVSVGKILISKQNFDTEERDRYCENLSFTPWHALGEHKPLGRTMRMRRDIYKATSKYRREINRVKLDEPDGFEIP